MAVRLARHVLVTLTWIGRRSPSSMVTEEHPDLIVPSPGEMSCLPTLIRWARVTCAGSTEGSIFTDRPRFPPTTRRAGSPCASTSCVHASLLANDRLARLLFASPLSSRPLAVPVFCPVARRCQCFTCVLPHYGHGASGHKKAARLIWRRGWSRAQLTGPRQGGMG
jgi:hypothetical protein